MTVPGLLVEYLVIGSMALIWFLPLMGVPFDQGASITLEKAAALGPAIYVIGMFIDFLAFWIFSGPTKKYCLKALAHSLIDIRPPEDKKKYQRLLWLHKNAPEVVKEINMRSSRDRIARGAVVNILLSYIVEYRSPLITWKHGNLTWQFIWIAMFIIGLLLWIFFEGNSYKFTTEAQIMAAEEIEKQKNI